MYKIKPRKWAYSCTKNKLLKLTQHIIIDSILVVYDTNYPWKEPRKKDVKYGYLCNERYSWMLWFIHA